MLVRVLVVSWYRTLLAGIVHVWLSVVFTSHLQTSKLKEQIQKVREVLSKKDTETPESIKAATDELQKSSLQLFALAYKKVT